MVEHALKRMWCSSQEDGMANSVHQLPTLMSATKLVAYAAKGALAEG
jgi:hypothetical protein